jgi:hypothetical protein
VTEDVAARIVRLPLFPDLTEAEVGFVIDSLTAALQGGARRGADDGGIGAGRAEP